MLGDSQLGQNFPNPVAGATTIDFVLERESFVTLRVHDLAVRLVATLVSSDSLRVCTKRPGIRAERRAGSTFTR